MLLSTGFLTAVFVALSTVDVSLLSRDDSGGGKTTISFTTKVDDLGANAIIEKDRARAQAMKQASHLHKRDGTTVSLVGGGSYHAMKIGIGQPPSEYTVVIDTGSSITWVGLNESKPYKQTHTSVSTGEDVRVTYSGVEYPGKGWHDALVLSSDLRIYDQFIAIASNTQDPPTVSGIDGVIGFGPVGLTQGKVSNTREVPTVMDNLRSQQKVRGTFGVGLNPHMHGGGNITIGGINHKAITRDPTWTRRTRTPPSSIYWGVNASWSYGDTTILGARAGVVDIGSSLIHMGPNAFKRLMARTNATMADNGFPRLNISQFHNIQNLTLHVGGKSFDLIRDALIWPPERNKEINGDLKSVYLMVNNLGGSYDPGSNDPASDPDDGLSFVVGHPFLNRYYSVYDDENERIGFAPTPYTYSWID